jgi:hypothetical protein
VPPCSDDLFSQLVARFWNDVVDVIDQLSTLTQLGTLRALLPRPSTYQSSCLFASHIPQRHSRSRPCREIGNVFKIGWGRCQVISWSCGVLTKGKSILLHHPARRPYQAAPLSSRDFILQRCVRSRAGLDCARAGRHRSKLGWRGGRGTCRSTTLPSAFEPRRRSHRLLAKL